ncbi:tetratricopeptide repeat protein [Sphingobacterium allocomposti]|uniref:Tetratricopeptide repeat protein n=1 Tax=Sphingobacterium allocomposti TaxID=415956 RepID=A0A5S5DF95_9SPHI|nr:tetratricopeptide repeat protein [Sphingobacterium composti Yoo et al. 2007 non Ten et al. 2007]TYP94680.1 tetratricopeptide repeat protein [Sphingobacterium composti Yoo et al. 2007 non Ten et al. 2007]
MTHSKLFLSLLLAGTIGSAGAQSLKDAKAALTAEQYDKAKGILQNLVEKKAKDGENYFYLGKIHLINDKVDSAAYVFNQGLTNAPKEQLNNVGLGIVDLMNGNQSAAESKFSTAVAGLGKKDYLPLLYIGEAYIDAPKPDYTKAIEYLTQAKAKNEKDPSILVALGDAYAGMGESSQAFVNYRDAEYMDPNLLAPKIGQAVISRRAQAYDVVIEQLTALTQEHPDYAPLYRELAETYYLSSLKAPEEQYREINQKGVENYKKYLSLTGDNSVEAKTRYADFLVYSGNYEELKTVAEELANAPGVDAKVYRYLGYIAYNQDKDYAKATEYMNTLFSKVQPERLIPRDYLYAGLANLSAGDEAKGMDLLKQAMEKQTEEDNLETEIAETAFAKYQDGDVENAVKIFRLPASMPESDYYYDANYYLGLGQYSKGSKIVSPAEGEEVTPELGQQKLQEGKPILDEAVKAFGIVVATDKEDVKKKYLINSLYYKGLSELALDGVMYDPEKAQGLFVDSFTKLLEAVKSIESDDANLNSYITDANNYLGYFYYLKGDNAKAKTYFQETIKVDPENEFAGQFVDQL